MFRFWDLRSRICGFFGWGIFRFRFSCFQGVRTIRIQILRCRVGLKVQLRLQHPKLQALKPNPRASILLCTILSVSAADYSQLPLSSSRTNMLKTSAVGSGGQWKPEHLTWIGSRCTALAFGAWIVGVREERDARPSP